MKILTEFTPVERKMIFQALRRIKRANERRKLVKKLEKIRGRKTISNNLQKGKKS